jgi:hydrogenase/urease accessory protein HupE
MNFIARTMVAVAFVATAAPASAHPVLGVTGFAGGLLHALLVPTHLMAVVALALLIGQQRRGHGAVIAYAAAIIAGLGAIALAYVPTRVEEGVLAVAASAGLLVALARPLPRSVGVLLAGASGLALALDSPPEAISLGDANLALLGTAIGAVIVLLALLQVTTRLTRAWQRIGARIVGSWIAASAILALALRLVG